MINRKVTNPNGNDFSYHAYDGYHDVLNSPIDNEENKERWANRFAGHQPDKGKSWYGIAGKWGADELCDLFTGGWTDGVGKLAKEADKFALDAPLSDYTVQRPRMRYGDEGEELDMQAVWSGDLDHAWMGFERRNQNDLKTRIHIMADVGGNAHVNASELKWPGIVAAALAKKAMDNNFDVKITACSYGFDRNAGNSYCLNTITLKHYDSLMSLANLAPIMLPALFRAVMFRAFFASAGEHKVGWGLGQTRPVTEENARLAMGSEMDDGTLIMVPALRSQSDAVSFYNKTIKTLKENS